MEIQELTSLVNNPQELINKIQAYLLVKTDDTEHLQYHPENQPVLNKILRKQKEVRKPNGVIGADGQEGFTTHYEDVARIPVALQRIIVSRAIMFLTGIPIEMEANPTTEAEKKLLAMQEKTWQDNKFEYRMDEVAEAMMSEKEAAVVFHFDETDPDFWGELGNSLSTKKLRHTLLKKSDGNLFYPVFNEVNNMTAFGRQYEVTIEADKKQKRLDVFTDDFTYKYFEDDNGWQPYLFTRIDKTGRLITDIWPLPNPVKKIQVVYFHQSRVEWADVEWAIEQFVKTFSDLSETNAYFGSPILKATGKIKGMASKGEKGKIYELENGGDLSYVTWNQAPESIRLELDMLKEIIYTITQTPDITFKELKGLGNLSGVALRMMFLDPHAKANRKHRGNYGEGVQRMFNYIKAALPIINPECATATRMSIAPKFGMFLPMNEIEELEIQEKKVQIIHLSTGGQQTMSQKTGSELNEQNPDAKKEFDLIQEEQKANAIGGTEF